MDLQILLSYTKAVEDYSDLNLLAVWRTVRGVRYFPTKYYNLIN